MLDIILVMRRTHLLYALLQDKDEMLAFVSEEVERLKVMFTSKEQRLVSERDSAVAEHGSATSQLQEARGKLQAAQQSAQSFSAELEVKHECLSQCLTHCPACQPG